jgi:hypothetical protein
MIIIDLNKVEAHRTSDGIGTLRRLVNEGIAQGKVYIGVGGLEIAAPGLPRDFNWHLEGASPTDGEELASVYQSFNGEFLFVKDEEEGSEGVAAIFDSGDRAYGAVPFPDYKEDMYHRGMDWRGDADAYVFMTKDLKVGETVKGEMASQASHDGLLHKLIAHCLEMLASADSEISMDETRGLKLEKLEQDGYHDNVLKMKVNGESFTLTFAKDGK